MKRSKFEDKSMGPMFPRLHVNDTERGGPRAPPRNKMALYEQLTIPSNRYSQGNMQINPSSGASQGTSNERIMYFPSYQHPVSQPLPSQSADRLRRQPSAPISLRPLGLQADQRRKDEDDFAVPIFSHQGKQQYKNANQSRNDEGRCRTFSSSCSFRYPNACNEETGQAESGSHGLRQDMEDQDDEQTTTIVISSSIDPPTVKYSVDISSRESSDGAVQLQEDVQMGDPDMNRTSSLKYANVDSRYSGSCGPIKEAEARVSSRLKSNSPFRQSNRNEIDSEDEENQRDDSLRENLGRANNVSRTSNVATVSDVDVSPDSVVDVIGLKHFWKARRAIVNQQRVFAVQVFELHRLIKVQQLIAESPEVLVDARAFIGKPSIKAAPIKNIPTQYALKALADSKNPKHYSPKPNPNPNDDNTEATSENNAVAKSPVFTSPPNPTHPNLTHHPQSPANPALQIPGPMAIPQPGGHQWLVPVMSPSEGLIYKPYPGPTFPAPAYGGGCGPHGTTAAHPFMNPNYGVPPPSPYYHHQGYFHPYGMSVMNSAASGSAVDQINRRSGSNPNGETGHTVIRVRNFSVQQQGSCNKATSQRHSELVGSTASSPSERAQDVVTRPVVARKEKDAFALFPARSTPPGARETEQPTRHVKAVTHNSRAPSQPRETERISTPIKAVPHNAMPSQPQPQPRETKRPATTLVKVVPHNARTATESAARIFRSIQEERRHNQPN